MSTHTVYARKKTVKMYVFVRLELSRMYPELIRFVPAVFRLILDSEYKNSQIDGIFQATQLAHSHIQESLSIAFLFFYYY